ncbi:MULTISPECIES: hypothetical protein [unclassified Granulicatella]|uniref:hypothetical protein n=1 Tax=unclassified Granulicatella TaxID=2630493 RepID=UPI001073D513|nr:MULTISPECIES: hypothetical protein [unclassified Granulicatella]MBF0780125.1 hypothetical protein [Granulicatella sp. 19428wC4_WM01]TFU95791.1 hypothetical protein E4T68_03360 [Granulicatella sp. WM01]
MPVVTEAKVRKLLKEGQIIEQGTFVLEGNDKLTPSAKGFLADHHVTVVYSGATSHSQSTVPHIPNIKQIDNIAHSAALPYVVRLARLYPILLRAQRAFHLDFEDDLCKRTASILAMLQQIVNHRIEDDVQVYNESFLSNAELQAIRIAKQLNPNDSVLDYTLSEGKLHCYEAYIECAIVRNELDILDKTHDVYIEKVSQLLKAIEVLLWLIID